MSNRGFTLIELMVAVVIIIVALLALAQSRVTTDRTATGASLSRDATALAQDLFEELKRLDFDSPAMQPGAYFDYPYGVALDWRRDWTITKEIVGGSPDDHLKKVELTVQWTQSGQLRTATFVTHIVRH